MTSSIPIIDISPLLGGSKSDIDKVTNDIADACKSIGFFYIINHGIPQALCNKVFAESRAFFDQPAEVKETINIKKSAHMRGYFSFVADKSDGINGDINVHHAYYFKYPDNMADFVQGHVNSTLH